MNILYRLFGQYKTSEVWEVGKATERGRRRALVTFSAILCVLLFLVQSATAQPTVIATIPAVGTAFGGISVNPSTNRIYVANRGPDTVSVIDGSTNIVVATIPAGPQPGGVGVNPTTNLVYVVNETFGVSVIDGNPGSPTENTVVAIIPVPGRLLSFTAGGIAVNSITNRIYVTSFDPGGAVVVIDGNTNAVLSLFGVAANPIVAAVNQVTNKIYVGHGSFFFRSRLTLIDGATNAVSDGPVVGLFQTSIGVNPNTKRLYVKKGDPSRSEPHGVVVLDSDTNAVVATIPLVEEVGRPSSGLGLSPITNRIYVAITSTDTISVIDGTPGSPTENTFIATVGVGRAPSFMAVNPVTNRIYVINIGSNTVSVIEDRVLVPFDSFLDVKVEIEMMGPLLNDDEFEVKALFTLGAISDGLDIPIEIVSLELTGGTGAFSTTIPAGNFVFHPAKPGKKGKPGKPAFFTFEGVINGVDLEVKVTDLGGGSFEFKAEGTGADLTSMANPVDVKLTIGNDGGSTTVEAEFE